jgi:multimeric flavodoxin WrbA
MKVLLINGSPRERGCTFTSLSEMADVLHSEGVKTEIFQIGKGPVQGCADCSHCFDAKKCVFENDAAAEALEMVKAADGIVLGSPVYFAGATGPLTSMLNRMFYSNRESFVHKPGAAVVCCRRGGSTATLEQLNKYLVISSMLLVGSLYWPMVHGNNPDEIKKDLEGLQNLRTLARNMAWILKSIQAGREAGVKVPTPEPERFRTNFIRE